MITPWKIKEIGSRERWSRSWCALKKKHDEVVEVVQEGVTSLEKLMQSLQTKQKPFQVKAK